METGHLARTTRNNTTFVWCGRTYPAESPTTPVPQWHGTLCPYCCDAYLYACGGDPLPVARIPTPVAVR